MKETLKIDPDQALNPEDKLKNKQTPLLMI